MKTAPSKRGPTSNKYALELRGQHCGWLTDVAGALTVGELGGDGRGGRYEELSLRCWPGMSRGFFEWVAGSFAAGPRGEDGEVILADDGYSEMSRLSFRGGVVTELSLPMYEYVLRDSVKFGIKFSPQTSRRSYAGGHLMGEAIDTRRPAAPTDPALHIDGLDEECSQIRKIEGFVIRQRIERVPGEDGLITRRSGAVEVAPLAVVLAESRAHGFVRWLQAVEAGRSNGRAASLTLGLASVGFTLVLHQVRPARITEEPAGDAESRRRELRVELSVRGVEFAFAPARPDVV